MTIGKHCHRCGTAIGEGDSPYCPPCQEEAKKDRERKREARWNKICPRQYQDTEEAKLTPQARAWVARIKAWEPDRMGLTIHGPSGRGKTRLAYLAMRAAFDKGKRKLGVVQATEIRVRLFGGFEEAGKLLDEATNPDVVLLDDLGQGAKSEQADSLILAILERRNRDYRPTIVTTQYDAKSIMSRFFSTEIAEAIVRRIGKGFATSVDLGQKEE